jgi:hypothetical protein
VYCGYATKGGKLRWATVIGLMLIGIVMIIAYFVQIRHCKICYTDGSACFKSSKWRVPLPKEGAATATSTSHITTVDGLDQSKELGAPTALHCRPQLQLCVSS